MSEKLIVVLSLSDKETLGEEFSYGVAIHQLGLYHDESGEDIAVRGEHLYENEFYVDKVIHNEDPLAVEHGPSEFAAFHNAAIRCYREGWHVVNPPKPESPSSKTVKDELIEALELSIKYLSKAEADGLMQDCVKPPRYALEKARAAVARANSEEKISDMNTSRIEKNELIGSYKFRSPYHKNKWLPFNVISISPIKDEFPVYCSTVEYKGKKSSVVYGYWSIESIENMIKNGKLIRF